MKKEQLSLMSADKGFGWNEPIGKKFNKEYKVKGVIKDIYYNAPIHPVAPAMFSLQKRFVKMDILFLK